jgi:hypothetical protein
VPAKSPIVLLLLGGLLAWLEPGAEAKPPHKVPPPPAPVDVQPTGRVDSARLFADVEALSADGMEGRRLGTPGGEKARHYIEAALEGAGVRPLAGTFEHPFEAAAFHLPGAGEETTPHRGVNVLGTLPGGAQAARYLVLSAHYDHLGIRGGEIYNGADDNASGVAVLLAAAHYFHGHPLRHTLLLAAFDGEEGGLLGAKAFVADPPVPLAAVALDVNLDMVARGDKNELYASGTAYHPEFKPLLEAIGARSGLLLRFGHDHASPTPGEDWTQESDQGPFHLAGIPFVYFGVEDHPDYHHPTDDFEKIPRKFFAASAETILAAVVALDRAVDPSPASPLPRSRPGAHRAPRG